MKQMTEVDYLLLSEIYRGQFDVAFLLWLLENKVWTKEQQKAIVDEANYIKDYATACMLIHKQGREPKTPKKRKTKE